MILSTKDFLTEPVYNAWKLDFDKLMAYRKSIKGKPDAYQMAEIELNKVFIDFYRQTILKESK